MTETSILRIVTCGSVDDGKSTLIGRLIAETLSVPEDVLESARWTRRTGSTIPAGEIDFSLLTDGLEAEREQGITIDVAYRHLDLENGQRAIIADAPGHEQYTRNMAVAASNADVAFLLIDSVINNYEELRKRSAEIDLRIKECLDILEQQGLLKDHEALQELHRRMYGDAEEIADASLAVCREALQQSGITAQQIAAIGITNQFFIPTTIFSLLLALFLFQTSFIANY